MKTRSLSWGAVVVVVLLGVSGCDRLRGWAVRLLDAPYTPQESGTAQAGTGPTAIFDGADARRPRLNVRLREVASGFQQPTDIQFPPGDRDRMVILEKGGRAHQLTRQANGTFGEAHTFVDTKVLVSSEEGLLGLAFHPSFAKNGRFYLNTVVSGSDGRDHTRIVEWTVADPAASSWSASFSRVVLEEHQPYPNHNAGQLAFGPDGMLYVGFGDGGFRDDPHGHGQNGQTRLGAMLRIDVDRPEAGRGYSIPSDNPFVGKPAYLPEIWAIGLRNPWRYAFDPQGRLIVADVGQGHWEEVDVVSAGDNLGWNRREGRHCFPPEDITCPTPNTHRIVDPIYEYSHESGDGASITGGYVVTAAEGGALQGRYVFGDFVSGRLWALDLPAETRPDPAQATVYALGRWGILVSTFGRDGDGNVYVADFAGGTVFLLEG